jgi:hypothetical protein
MHLGCGLKLLDAHAKGISLLAVWQGCEFVLEPQPLRFEALFECMGLRPFAHLPSSVVAGPGCWPNARRLQ